MTATALKDEDRENSMDADEAGRPLGKPEPKDSP